MIASIPQECIQYTQVFTVMKLEFAICIAVGIAIGIFAERWHK